MLESLVLGGDPRGTSTRVLVVGTDGRVRGRSTAAAGNPISHPDGAAAAFGDALRAALAGVDPVRVEASVIGVAGVSALRTASVAARFGQVWADAGCAATPGTPRTSRSRSRPAPPSPTAPSWSPAPGRPPAP